MPEPYRIKRAGEIGFIDSRDVRPSQMPGQAWSSVQNMRMANGSAFVAPTFAQQTDVTDTDVIALDYYNGPASQHNILYTNQYIYTLNSAGVKTQVKDMAGDAGSYPSEIWVTDQFSSIPIATNNRGSPQCQYNNGGVIDETTPFVPFPDWDTGGTYENAQCLGVASYKNFIVAFNIVDVSAFPNLVAWSDAAEAGLMPASWDYTDPSTLAGRRVVGAADGILLAARVQRDSLILYAERGTYRMTFVPGSEFVMDITRIFDNFGAFGPRSVGSYGAQHLVVTKDKDIIRHDGQQHLSVAEDRIRERVIAVLTEEDTNRVYVVPYVGRSEMWIGVPNDANLFLTMLTWRWSDQGVPWSVRDIPDSRHAALLPILESSSVDDSWDTGPDETWDGGQNIIWDQGAALGDFQMIGTSTDGFIYTLDEAPQTNFGTIERQGINLYMDNTLETITEFVPQISGEDDVYIQIGGQQVVEGPVTWGPVDTFRPGVDYHITRLVTGRRHAIRLYGNDFRLDGYEIFWDYAGED